MKKGVKNIILDLDHCLFFAAYDKIPELELKGRFQIFYFYHRPGLKEFMDYVEKKYDLIFYTSARARYANRVVLSFKLKREYPIYSRKYCKLEYTEYGERYRKGLDLIGLKENNPIKILDDRPDMWDEKGVELIDINPWHGEVEDDELLKLINSNLL